jgi:hypothetical protein
MMNSSTLLKATGLTLTDCTLTDGGHIYRMGVGVLIEACKGCTIAHNDIHQFFYTAISTGYGFKSGLVYGARFQNRDCVPLKMSLFDRTLAVSVK